MQKLMHSFQYAFTGIVYAIRHNQNVRLHFLLGILTILVSLLLALSREELITIGMVIMLVIATEMVNTAIEQMVNLITKEHRQEAKIAKDVAAGMVLVVSLGAIVIGLLIFLPHVLSLVS